MAFPNDLDAVEESHDLVPQLHSIEGNVAEALVIKDENLFFLTDPTASIRVKNHRRSNGPCYVRIYEQLCQATAAQAAAWSANLSLSSRRTRGRLKC